MAHADRERSIASAQPKLAEIGAPHNGASLFAKGLQFVELGGHFGLASMRRTLEKSGFAIGEGWVPLSVGLGSEVAWACNSDGRVRGFGQDALPYGPNVPVATWFADQVTDLSFAAANRLLPWASRALGT